MATVIMGVIIVGFIAFVVGAMDDEIDEAEKSIKAQIADLQRSMEEKLLDIDEHVQRIEDAFHSTRIMAYTEKAKSAAEQPKRSTPRYVDFESTQKEALKEFEPDGHPV